MPDRVLQEETSMVDVSLMSQAMFLAKQCLINWVGG
jgi:hypothetical protein